MKLLYVVVVLLLSVGIASADEFVVSVNPATVEPNEQYQLRVEYRLDAATVIQNVAQVWVDGVLRTEVSAPVDVQTDPPAPNVELRVPPIAGASPQSARLTLPDGSEATVLPAPDGTVNGVVGNMVPGDVAVLAVWMLVL